MAADFKASKSTPLSSLPQQSHRVFATPGVTVCRLCLMSPLEASNILPTVRGMEGLTRSPLGITIVLVCPGHLLRAWKNHRSGTFEKWRHLTSHITPIGRNATLLDGKKSISLIFSRWRGIVRGVQLAKAWEKRAWSRPCGRRPSEHLLRVYVNIAASLALVCVCLFVCSFLDRKSWFGQMGRSQTPK